MADLFDVVVARKLSGGGGGGGSSDFSTAQVTVVNNSGNEVELTLIHVASTPWGDVLSSVADIGTQDSQTISAVLYNNSATVDVYGLNASVSGNASLDNNVVTVTGDCTITIS